MSSYKGKTLYLDFSKLPRPERRFTLGRVLDTGICSKILEAVDHDNGGQRVAIKVLNNLSENVDAIEEEYRIFKDLSRHDNFPTFYGAFLNKFDKEDKDELWLVMEYCMGGSLGDFIAKLSRNHRNLPESLIGYILREVVNALSYLHMNHIVHRDIKARNILLTEDGRVKLTDFGFSRHLKRTLDKRNTAIGSPHWLAPEVISSNPDNFQSQNLQDIDSPINGYDHRCDIWSLGITAIELANGEPPLWNLHPVRVLFQIVHNPPPEIKKPGEWSASFKDFIAECLVKNPDHRPFAMELMEHPFLQEVPEDDGMLRNQLKTLISKHTTSHDLDRPYEVIVKDGKMKIDPNAPFKRIYPDDLATMDVVDEERVLLTLGNRFSRGNFQTYAGNILMIISPLIENNVYDQEHHQRYTFKALSDEEPHIFAIVDRAWQDMLHHKEHQNIILSGDRNSGKSFNFNQIVRHLCFMAKGNAATADRIEQLPAILDCFGNAATDGNANSSRHVRYLELTFTESGKLSGAIINVYLLEKWRICDTLSKSNRNYHIFYYIYYGLKKEGALKRYFLDSCKQFRFLPIGETDAEVTFYLNGYAKLKEYLRFWDMENQEQEFIFQTIAAILLLGQIGFDGDQQGATVGNPDILNKAATLLSVNPAKLGWALCNKSTIVHGTSEVTSNSPEMAGSIRDALARGIYSRLVDWLVNNLNINMCLGRKVFGEKHTIGVLDPPGFDTVPRKHSFEQLISNCVNEQLSFHYNQFVFAKEIAEYEGEGVKVEDFEFRDNRYTLNALLNKPDGLLYVIDELSRSSTSDANVLAESLEKILTPEYFTLDGDDGSLTFHHSGGSVHYRTDEFMDRNRDFLPVELIEVMRLSTNMRLSSIFINKMTKTGNVTMDSATTNPPAASKRYATGPHRNKGVNTVSQGEYSQSRQMQTQIMKTRHSLVQLLRKLVCGSPHFVRCLRRCPTSSGPQKPGIDKKYLTEQIRSFSLVEAIRIQQRGFTYRIPFEEFLRRYQFLAFDFDEQAEVTVDNCRLLFLRLKLDGWMLGKTKVFIKYYTVQYLSRLYEEQVRKIVKVQALLRGVMAKLRKKRGASGARRRSRELSKDDAAIAIQKNYRGYSVRKEQQLRGVGPDGKKRFECDSIEEEAAHTIQYFWRKWKGKSLFQQLLLYRADKQQQLTYFCQQVHVYNQEYCGHVRKTGPPMVNVNKITREERQPLTAKPKGRLALKLPLLLKNRHFLDTTFMCAGVGGFDKSKLEAVQKSAALKAKKSISPPKIIQREKTPPPILKQQKSPSPTPMARATSPVVNNSAVSSQIKNFNKPNVQVNEWNGRPALQSPSIGLSKPLAPKVNNHTNFIGAADHRQIAREIEKKAAQFSAPKSVEEDDSSAPFNFQAMLRKTDHSRGSMKRNIKNQGGSLDELESKILNAKTGSSLVYQSNGVRPSVKSSKAPQPTKIEVIPGLVIEGQEADL